MKVKRTNPILTWKSWRKNLGRKWEQLHPFERVRQFSNDVLNKQRNVGFQNQVPLSFPLFIHHRFWKPFRGWIGLQEETHKTHIFWATNLCIGKDVWTNQVFSGSRKSETGLRIGNEWISSKGKPLYPNFSQRSSTLNKCQLCLKKMFAQKEWIWNIGLKWNQINGAQKYYHIFSNSLFQLGYI